MSNSLTKFKELIQQNQFLVLDSETTSLTDGEICQIAIIDAAGSVLLNSYVKTVYPIPPDASSVHHITDTHVAAAPSWGQLIDQIRQLLTGRDVVVYNAVYDRKMMHQSAEKAGLPKTDWKAFSRWHCAMEAFAEVYGDWNSYRSNYRWQSLTTAARYYRIPLRDAHSALGDCRMTLAVVQAMVRPLEDQSNS